MKFWLGWMAGITVMLLGLFWGFSQWNLQYYNNYIGDRLELLAELRKGALEEYFTTAEAELRFWSKNETLLQAQQQLNEIWQADGKNVSQNVHELYVARNPNPAGYLMHLDDAEDGGPYSELHANIHPTARLFVTERGYYDFFLIGPAGDVYYTVEKEKDFATNLDTGPWKKSGLAEIFALAKKGAASKKMVVSDMQAYGPSDGAPAIFVATALHDVAGEFIGVLAFQLPTDRILGIMAYTSGMGDTGETYLVGEDLLMRSDSRFSEESTVLSQLVDTETVHLALAGERGRATIVDYRGVEVLSGYMPLDVGRARWAVMTEMDQEEVVEFAASQRPPLGGALLLIYGLSLWSVWYWRGRNLPEEGVGFSDVDLSDSGGGDLGA